LAAVGISVDANKERTMFDKQESVELLPERQALGGGSFFDHGFGEVDQIADVDQNVDVDVD
jgi:hypothetical protein